MNRLFIILICGIGSFYAQIKPWVSVSHTYSAEMIEVGVSCKDGKGMLGLGVRGALPGPWLFTSPPETHMVSGSNPPVSVTTFRFSGYGSQRKMLDILNFGGWYRQNFSYRSGTRVLPWFEAYIGVGNFTFFRPEVNLKIPFTSLEGGPGVGCSLNPKSGWQFYSSFGANMAFLWPNYPLNMKVFPSDRWLNNHAGGFTLRLTVGVLFPDTSPIIEK